MIRNTEINGYPYLMGFGRKNTSVYIQAKSEAPYFFSDPKLVLPFVAEETIKNIDIT